MFRAPIRATVILSLAPRIRENADKGKVAVRPKPAVVAAVVLRNALRFVIIWKKLEGLVSLVALGKIARIAGIAI
jgi:hypothetical protein